MTRHVRLRNRQRGLAAVEFAMVGTLAMFVLIGTIEISRFFYTWNSMVEATRRGARVAAVTSGTSAAIAAMTAMDVGDLASANVTVTYYDESGNVTAVTDNIRFVTVAISGLTHSVLFPGNPLTIAVPAFSTTIPTESLGWVPS